MMFHDEGDNMLYYYDGTDWQNLASAGGGESTPPGGSAYQFQYNDGASAFAGAANLFYDASNNVTVGSQLTASGSALFDSLVSISDKLEVWGSATSSFEGPVSTSEDLHIGELFVDNSAGRVGFGNENPQELFQVGGGVDTSSLTETSFFVSNHGNTAMAVRDSLNDSELYMLANSTAGFIRTVTNHQLRLGAANTTVMTIDTDFNVGIGDTDPSYKLSVDGTASISDDFYFGHDLLVGNIVNNGVSISGDFSVDSASGLFFVDSSANTVEIGAAGSDVQIGETGSPVNLTIIETGRVGIGDSSPGYGLSVDNTASISSDTYIWTVAGVTDIDADAQGKLYNASDLRLKKNITTIDNALNKLTSLRGVYYNWKTPEEGNDYIVMDDTILHMGFIAQEVASAVPELAYVHGAQEINAVRESDMIALVIEGMKEMTNIFDISAAPRESSSLTVDYLGNLGVGGSVSVSEDLQISGDLYVDSLASASNAYVYADAEGKLHSGSAYSDLAEYMPLASESFEAGDVVISRPATEEEKANGLTNEPFIGVKASTSYDNNLLGVVSYSDIPALGTKVNDNYLPIALIGRVPVKVSTENGSIQPGDYLTSSTKPGVAMKATEAGPVIGKALEAYNNSNPDIIGSVILFINIGWYGGEVSEIAINPDGTVDDTTSDISFETPADFLNNLAGGLAQLGASIKDGVIKATKIIVNEINTKIVRIDVEENKDNVVGSATIPAQSIEYRVENSLIEENSKIFISFNSDAGGRTWHISEKAAGHGFTIRLSDVTPEELEFDYWIVLIGGGTADSSEDNDPAPYCSDGNLDPGEECDDGNLVDGDGCDMTCITESIVDEPINDEPASGSEEPLTEEPPAEEPQPEPIPDTPQLPQTEDVVEEPLPGEQAAEEQPIDESLLVE